MSHSKAKNDTRDGVEETTKGNKKNNRSDSKSVAKKSGYCHV